MTKLKIPLNETRFKNKTYAAIIGEIERLEHKDAYRGNGHHLAQRLVDMLYAAFEDDLEDQNSGEATTNTTHRMVIEEIHQLEQENKYLSTVIDNVRKASRQRGSVVAGQAVCEIIHEHDHNIRPNATDTATKLRAYFEMQEARINDLTQIKQRK